MHALPAVHYPARRAPQPKPQPKPALRSWCASGFCQLSASEFPLTGSTRGWQAWGCAARLSVPRAGRLLDALTVMSACIRIFVFKDYKKNYFPAFAWRILSHHGITGQAMSNMFQVHCASRLAVCIYASARHVPHKGRIQHLAPHALVCAERQHLGVRPTKIS